MVACRSEKRAAALAAATAVVDGCKTSNGYWVYTAEEWAETDRLLAEVDEIDAHLEKAEKDEALMKRLGTLRDESTARPGTSWAKAAAGEITKVLPTGPEGQKAVVSCMIGTPT